MYRYRINLFIISSIIALLWLVPFGAGQELKAKDTVWARTVSKRVVDVCGQRKDQVIVVIDLGKIVKTDSLFGCNFQLSYDSTKLRFHSALYLNTLAEFFEFKQVGFFRDGHIRGAVATLGMQPVAGDRPLVGFLGDFIGDCHDSVMILFDYLEFTDEFKKKIIYENGFVAAVTADKPDRYFQLTADSDTTVIDTLENEASFAIGAKQGIDSIVKKLEMRLEMKNFDNFYVKSLEPADTNLLKIDSIDIADTAVYVSFFVNGVVNNKNIAIVDLVEKEKAEEVAEILIKPVGIDDGCSCFSRLLGDVHYVKSAQRKKDTIMTVDRGMDGEITDNYYSASNIWFINSKSEPYRVMIYDILGNLMVDRRSYAGISRISLDGFSNGVYYGIIQNSKTLIKRKILIKN